MSINWYIRKNKVHKGCPEDYDSNHRIVKLDIYNEIMYALTDINGYENKLYQYTHIGNLVNKFSRYVTTYIEKALSEDIILSKYLDNYDPEKIYRPKKQYHETIDGKRVLVLHFDVIKNTPPYWCELKRNKRNKKLKNPNKITIKVPSDEVDDLLFDYPKSVLYIENIDHIQLIDDDQFVDECPDFNGDLIYYVLTNNELKHFRKCFKMLDGEESDRHNCAAVWLDELIENGGLKEDEFLSFYVD